MSQQIKVVMPPDAVEWTEAAVKLFKSKESEGYKHVDLHLYRAQDGAISYARVRMHKRSSEGGHEKLIRPFWRNGVHWTYGEPNQKSGKLLYGLQDILSSPSSLVVLTEGEQKADAITRLGAGELIGVTSGGAQSARGANWTCLAGRRVLLWPDNDEPGTKYAMEVASKLEPLGCAIEKLDVGAMGLPHKGDAIDWIALFCDARGREPNAADVLALPRESFEGNAGIERAALVTAPLQVIGDKQCTALVAEADRAIARTLSGDAGALFEIVSTLGVLRTEYPADYARIRVRVKEECRKVRLADLERLMRGDVNATDEKSTADLLIEMADDHCELFRDPDRNAFALIENCNHRECWPVRSSGFREWLSFSFYQEHGRAPNDLAISNALATIEGKAKFDGEERLTYLRVASADGAIWIDLCNDKWQAIQVTSTGWRIIDNPPIHFVRTATMRALPVPATDGSFAPLWEIINVPVSERLLVVTWVLECFRPATPYAVLELTGEQGSAKSTTQHFLRELIDPNRANNRSAPKGVEDVFVAAQNAHLMSFENLSHLPPAYQDALCVLATGGGYSTRRLFSNADESVLDLKRPVVLNGIAVIVTAQDLSDRTLHIDLPTIEARTTANEIEKMFEANRSGIFGALLDVFARSLAELQKVVLEDMKLPRMADFAQLGEAVYRVHGKPSGAFLSDYDKRRRESVYRTLEASPVATAILSYMDANPTGFSGTIGRLHEVLTGYRQDTEAWPKSAKGMGDAFRRLAPALRQIGISAWASERRGMQGYSCSLKKVSTLSGTFKSATAQTEVHKVHDVQYSDAPAHQADELYERHEPSLAQHHTAQDVSFEDFSESCAVQPEVEDDL